MIVFRLSDENPRMATHADAVTEGRSLPTAYPTLYSAHTDVELSASCLPGRAEVLLTSGSANAVGGCSIHRSFQCPGAHGATTLGVIDETSPPQFLHLATAIAALLAVSRRTSAQSYPTRAVELWWAIRRAGESTSRLV